MSVFLIFFYFFFYLSLIFICSFVCLSFCHIFGSLLLLVLSCVNREKETETLFNFFGL